jgi:hypothetical protein
MLPSPPPSVQSSDPIHDAYDIKPESTPAKQSKSALCFGVATKSSQKTLSLGSSVAKKDLSINDKHVKETHSKAKLSWMERMAQEDQPIDKAKYANESDLQPFAAQLSTLPVWKGHPMA